MALQGDAAVAARDPALPGLAAALDPERAAALARAYLPSAGVQSARATYVRYKPGTACVVALRLATGDGTLDAYLRVERPDDMAKLAKHAGRHEAAVLVPELAAALYPFGADRRVSALPALTDGRRRPGLLRRALPDHPELWDARLQALNWKPERRFVGRLDGPGGERAVVKVHAGDATRTLRTVKKAGDANAPTPRRLGRSYRHNLVVLEWLPGIALDGTLATEDGARAAHGAGRALATLHSGSTAGLRVLDRAHELRRLRATVAMIGRLEPALAEDARRTAERIAARLPHGSGAALTHGDFTADQVIVCGEEVTLLDLDEAAVAAPERDLGSFLAALDRATISRALDGRRADAAAAALLEGYAEEAGAPDRVAVSAWTAAALLHLAPEPFRHRETAWPEAMAAIVARAAHPDAGR